jgi:hypothetical protein
VGAFVVTESDVSVRGDPLQEFLSATDGIVDAPLLTESDYVRNVLEFANTKNPAYLHALRTMLISGVKLQGQVYFDALEGHLNPHLLALAERLEKQLETIRTNTRKARADLADEVRRAGERIAIRPSYIVTKSGVEVFYRHFPADLEAAIGYALLLLLDPTRGYGSDLCRCKLAECGRFFPAIKPPTGRPRRDYCCAEHLEAAREKSSVDRVRAFRERQKAKASRRRHRAGRL